MDDLKTAVRLVGVIAGGFMLLAVMLNVIGL